MALPFFLVGHNWILNVVIETQWENGMLKQWVQPPIEKNSLPPCHLQVFFIRVPSHKFDIYVYY